MNKTIERCDLSRQIFNIITNSKWHSLELFFLPFLMPIIGYKYFSIDEYEFAFLITSPIYGVLLSSICFILFGGDSKKIKRIYSLSTISVSLSYILMYIAIIYSNYTLLVVTSFLVGFFKSNIGKSLSSIIAYVLDDERKGEALGYRNRQSGIGAFIGPAIGFFLLSCYPYEKQYAYSSILIFSLSNLFAGALNYRIYNLLIFKKGKSVISLKSEFNFALTLLLIALFIEGLAIALLAPYIQPFLISRITRHEYLLALIYLPGGVVAAVLAPKFGKFIDEGKFKNAFLWVSFIGAITTFLITMSDDLITLSLLFFIDSLAITFLALLIDKIISTTIQNSGSFFGVKGLIIGGTSILGPFLGAAIWKSYGDLVYPFYFSAVVEAISGVAFFIALFFLAKDIKRKKQ
ncbi:MAG: MFS transporter [Bacteriovoracaceae bacterium]|nr:MFS transporter [Bacteriovoracaceae bacterium]